MVKVSVILPVYGVAAYIEKCAQSLMNQTLQEMEFLFVDDHGPDNSIELLKQTIKGHPREKQFRVLTPEHNLGAGMARNFAIPEAKGEYIAFVDSDDWVERDYIDRLVDAAEIHDTKFAYCSLSLETGGRGQISILPLKTGKHKVEEVFDNIFFSYKYGDDSVYQTINHRLFEGRVNITPRDYLNVLETYIENYSAHYYKGDKEQTKDAQTNIKCNHNSGSSIVFSVL